MQSRLPMHRSPRCGARTRNGTPCRSPAMPNGRCRMHGGGRRARRRVTATPSSTAATPPTPSPSGGNCRRLRDMKGLVKQVEDDG